LLNGYGHTGLSELERKRWERAYEAGDEDASCHLMGPEQLVDNIGEFLGYFMIRKVAAGQELLRAAGTVTKSLAKWLHQQGWIDDDALAVGVDRGGDAARDLPKADKLAGLLWDLAQRAPRIDDPDAVADEDWVEDYLQIERVEPGALWFEGAWARSRCRRRSVRWPRTAGASTWCSPGCEAYGGWSRSATSTRDSASSASTGMAVRLGYVPHTS